MPKYILNGGRIVCCNNHNRDLYCRKICMQCEREQRLCWIDLLKEGKEFNDMIINNDLKWAVQNLQSNNRVTKAIATYLIKDKE